MSVSGIRCAQLLVRTAVTECEARIASSCLTGPMAETDGQVKTRENGRALTSP